ncbi:MAG: hypothetical protein JXA60_09100 [Candidatus Coatesbacteria bacterium]|nr:hypothetical protein [Candidatus Coatesbacteria bacterium]
MSCNIFVYLVLLTIITYSFAEVDFSKSGTFDYDSLTVSIPGDGETMSNSMIYHPWDNGKVPDQAKPCPIVVFGHGWQMPIDRYNSYARHLATWGYIVVLPTFSNPVVNPEHERRSRCLIAAARYIVNLNNQSSSRLFNAVDTDNWGFAGHSLGGSLSLLAASLYGVQLRDSLHAVVSFSGPKTTPDTQEENILCAKMILGGTKDKICDWIQMRADMWDKAKKPGVFAIIKGANHNQFMDYSTPLEDIFDGKADINRLLQLKLARRHMTAYIERYLKNDKSKWNYSFCYGDSMKGSSYMDTVETREDEMGFRMNLMAKLLPDRDFSVSPNPVKYSCNFKGFYGKVYIYDSMGKLVDIHSTKTSWIPDRKLKNGVYIASSENGKSKILIILRD